MTNHFKAIEVLYKNVPSQTALYYIFCFMPQDEIEKLTCQLRICEKEILVNCVAYCEQKLQQIQAANKPA
jgi:hypothetical protein